MPRLHEDELPIDARLVRTLLDTTFPQYSGDDLRRLGDAGSSNALFRLGDDKLVRLPLQSGGGASILKEAAWLPFVESHVSIQIPEVIAVGEPHVEVGYPERWAVTSWLTGSRPVPARDATRDTRTLARDLARFLTDLRGMPVADGLAGIDELSGYRGLPLADLDSDFREVMAECRGLGLDLDLDDVARVWDDAAEASLAVDPVESWYHGDLLGENLLLTGDGRLSAVIDFGALAIGNPTVDLAVAWDVLDAAGRHVIRRALDVDPHTWLTSRGWALLLALMVFPYYGNSMPVRCASRLAMAQAALQGW